MQPWQLEASGTRIVDVALAASLIPPKDVVVSLRRVVPKMVIYIKRLCCSFLSLGRSSAFVLKTNVWFLERNE